MSTRLGIVLFCAAMTVVLPAFVTDFWRTADKSTFSVFQSDGDDLVASAMLHSKVTEHLSSPVGLGCYEESAPGCHLRGLDAEQFRRTERAFAMSVEPGPYFVYPSQIGLHAYFFTILDRLLHQRTLTLYRALNATFCTIALAFIVCWAAREHNLGAAMLLLLSIVFCKWLVYFGHSLFWEAWMWFAPMIASGWFLQRHEARPQRGLSLMYPVVGFLILLKCATGYEYISTFNLAAAAPVVYYGIKNRWGIRILATRVVLIGVAGVLGFSGAVLVHAAMRGPTFVKGLSAIVDDGKRRSYGSNPDQFPKEYRESLRVSPLYVVGMYLKVSPVEHRPVPLRLNADIKAALKNGSLSTRVEIASSHTGAVASYLVGNFGLSYLSLILFLGVTELLYWFPWKRFRTPRMDGLAVTLIFSISAPLSWLVLAKAHSYIHIHMNPIVWQLPFTLVGAMFVGSVGQDMLLKALQTLRAKFAS